jgi:predicted O-methyltransferase YrrM
MEELLSTDIFWSSTADFVEQHWGRKVELLAPNEFNHRFYGTYAYRASQAIPLEQLQVVVLHKGMLEEIPARFLNQVLDEWTPVFANEVFVVWVPQSDLPSVKDSPHVTACYEKAEKHQTPVPDVSLNTDGSDTVILVTTYNRPTALKKSLPGILALGVPVLIVEDGSDASFREAYDLIYHQHAVDVLRIPQNRGLPNALNTGLGYWLANEQIQWISYLQDDVEVHPDLLQVLAKIQHPQQRPLLSGRDDPLHTIFGRKLMGGEEVYLKQMSPGIHLHAHRDYWKKVMPIPAPYFQAPKASGGQFGQGADEDWWICQWSPDSIVKRGRYVHVVPGLVRTTTMLGVESTWDSAGNLDPPLRDGGSKSSAKNGSAKVDEADQQSPADHSAASKLPTNFWQVMATCFPAVVETEVHHHSPSECADLYHSIDGGSTELEVLNIINALVCLFKPENALETGSFMGFGSCAIAAGLEANSRGKLASLELYSDCIKLAEENVRQFNPDLLNRIQFHCGASIEYIKNYQGAPFDFVFFDTELEIRAQEFELMMERNLLNPNAICLFHDTSEVRVHHAEGTPTDERVDRKGIAANCRDQFDWFEFPFSRGFLLLRKKA